MWYVVQTQTGEEQNLNEILKITDRLYELVESGELHRTMMRKRLCPHLKHLM